MARKTYTRVLACLAAVGLAACGAASAEDAELAAPPDPTVEAEQYRWRNQALAYETAVYVNQAQAVADAAFWNGVLAWATEANRPPSPPKSAPVPSRTTAAAGAGKGSGGGSVSGACGGSRFDYVIDDESGGNPNARNPSGAWGCYQIMPGTWAGAGCNDFGSHGSAPPSAQAACADRLEAGDWAASQGG